MVLTTHANLCLRYREILAPGAKPFMKVHFVVARKLAY